MSTIPKIELKITISQLREAYMAIQFDLPIIIPFSGEKEQKFKSYYSLLQAVDTKLAKKVISHQHKTKPFKLTLEYYEANCIHKTLMAVELNRHAQEFFNQLDQKLA